MKYLITESKLDSIILQYLDNQDFIWFKNRESIYFVNSEEDEYAQIRYDKRNGLCIIHYKFVNEISSFFSLQRSDSEEIIGRWVENTLQTKVTDIRWVMNRAVSELRIPN